MANEKSAWVMNVAIRIALIVFLSMLALGLINGADPVVAVARSGVAFIAFLVLGWGASMLWLESETEATEEEADKTDDTADEASETASVVYEPSHPPLGTATAMPAGAMSAPQE